MLHTNPKGLWMFFGLNVSEETSAKTEVYVGESNLLFRFKDLDDHTKERFSKALACAARYKKYKAAIKRDHHGIQGVRMWGGKLPLDLNGPKRQQSLPLPEPKVHNVSSNRTAYSTSGEIRSKSKAALEEWGVRWFRNYHPLGYSSVMQIEDHAREDGYWYAVWSRANSCD